MKGIHFKLSLLILIKKLCKSVVHNLLFQVNLKPTAHLNLSYTP